MRNTTLYPTREVDPEAVAEAIANVESSMDSCPCSGWKFCEFRKEMEARKVDCETLIQETGLGSDCEVCLPYLRKAVAEGTDVAVVNSVEPSLWRPEESYLEKNPPKEPKKTLSDREVLNLQEKDLLEGQDVKASIDG